MGPKKIKKPQQSQKKEDSPPQKKNQEAKSEVKTERQSEKVNPPSLKKETEVKPEPIRQKQTQKNTQKIFLDGPKLSEQQLLRIRRQKFRTSAIANQSEKIKQQRLKKFGGPNYQTKQQLLERKKKFLSNNIIQTEDQAILRQRRQKFFTAVASSDPADVLEQRKKKFASSQQVLVDLDQEIKKSQHQTKPIKKAHKNKFKRHDGPRKKGERFQRKKNKFGGSFQRKNHLKSGEKQGITNFKKRKTYIKRRPIKSKN